LIAERKARAEAAAAAAAAEQAANGATEDDDDSVFLGQEDYADDAGFSPNEDDEAAIELELALNYNEDDDEADDVEFEMAQDMPTEDAVKVADMFAASTVERLLKEEVWRRDRLDPTAPEPTGLYISPSFEPGSPQQHYLAMQNLMLLRNRASTPSRIGPERIPPKTPTMDFMLNRALRCVVRRSTVFSFAGFSFVVGVRINQSLQCYMATDPLVLSKFHNFTIFEGLSLFVLFSSPFSVSFS
jgi:hypothetical protein